MARGWCPSNWINRLLVYFQKKSTLTSIAAHKPGPHPTPQSVLVYQTVGLCLTVLNSWQTRPKRLQTGLDADVCKYYSMRIGTESMISTSCAPLALHMATVTHTHSTLPSLCHSQRPTQCTNPLHPSKIFSCKCLTCMHVSYLLQNDHVITRINGCTPKCLYLIFFSSSTSQQRIFLHERTVWVHSVFIYQHPS